MALTLIGIFQETVETHRKPAQFIRKTPQGWEQLSAERARTDVESLALALRELGIAPGDRVALVSENRYEWAVTDLAVVGMGAVLVPIYPTLTAEQCRYILADAEVKVAVASSLAQLDKLRSATAGLAHVRHRVVMEPAPPVQGEEHSFADLLARGQALRAAEPGAFAALAAEVRPDTLATLIYTSGTTGEPKGAMLTHGNIAANVEACLRVVDLSPADTSLSFLPLCHIFERMGGHYAMLRGGVSIAYAQNLESVAADAQVVRPTVMTGVPRFYEKVYARVMENAATQPPLRRAIFHWGMRVSTEVVRRRFRGEPVPALLALQARIADRLVGAKVRARVGGRLRFCISGGAPLGPKVMEFFYAIGIPVLEGYGLTETSPVITLNPPGRARPGSVGPAVPGVEVRIGDEGEILTRGPHVMQGYFRNDAATAACLRDGWFHTGDVGHLDADGFLHITDRLKDLIVTAGGKKVAPQPLEGRLKASKWISEAVMLGDQRPFCVALLVPNFANLEAQAAQHGWGTPSREALVRHPAARALIQSEIDALNVSLSPFETIKRFELLDRDLSAEAGELTPTLKVRRRVLQQKFHALIEGMYESRGA
jgi:long-chain acyl-CoA synthetase